ncbi:hypothetical protein NIES2101_43005 [Calothrix sp. HK-06]|nr:hypothetical protein NIES2101_43005 [Calothrix sp. HK-06]
MGCIDAPEMAQKPHGDNSAQRLKQLLPTGKVVNLRAIQKDKYNRTVGEIFIGDKSINLQMVQEGHAVVYRQYLSNCASIQKQYVAAEANAKRQKLAFWNQSKPVMPWDFRKGCGATQQSRQPTQSQQTQNNCDPSYPDFCIPKNLPDLNCPDVAYKNFRVVGNDPHGFDRDGDGIGCER